MSKQDISHNGNLSILKKIDKLRRSTFNKRQMELVEEITNEGISGQEELLNLLIKRIVIQKSEASCLDGFVFQILNKTNFSAIKKNVDDYFSNGIIKINNKGLKIDYQPLQNLLINQEFKQADKLTQLYLCRLAGIYQKEQRNWLYFTDVQFLPAQDLHAIDTLWRIYSAGKFGFSVQRRIWLANNCNWEKLWNKIGWKKSGVSSRYPNEFVWSMHAPNGHLPLFNQLRGVQALKALFNHVAWSKANIL
uniref:GUN4-like domain-containing protein n=1 Tax=Rhodymenia pseudopalmata TaxID=31502 RepID=A0A1C9C7P6_RHOPU|nr:hypothetical protein Rhodyp_123 [Rhodymenia pseudopalmata]AOM64401.1 hypothetical protein Rhodyp_123 [Rhodymenia pseudopalmata]